MGWPLAVSSGLMEKSPRALMAALGPLAAGHLLAMLLVLLPFALLVALVEWQRQIQIGSSLLVIGFGIFRLANRRHPRALARIRPTQLGFWSFAVAIAHGAGLMLVPIYLGLCRISDFDKGHEAAGTLMNADLGMVVLVPVVHALGVPLERRARCACRKLNPAILVMQSTQDWATKNVPGAIDGARDRRIFVQG
jgi:hypothetical protein